MLIRQILQLSLKIISFVIGWQLPSLRQSFDGFIPSLNFRFGPLKL